MHTAAHTCSRMGSKIGAQTQQPAVCEHFTINAECFHFFALVAVGRLVIASADNLTIILLQFRLGSVGSPLQSLKQFSNLRQFVRHTWQHARVQHLRSDRTRPSADRERYRGGHGSAVGPVSPASPMLCALLHPLYTTPGPHTQWCAH